MNEMARAAYEKRKQVVPRIYSKITAHTTKIRRKKIGPFLGSKSNVWLDTLRTLLYGLVSRTVIPLHLQST